MRILMSFILCLLMISVPRGVSAAAEEWVATKATAQVAYTLDRETWVPLKKGMSVPNKAWISTGPKGRLQLVRGTESIAFQPNTLASITTRGSDQSRKTDVVQQVGELSLEIEKRQRPHTTVQTPFLAAVVKGTRFTVEVGKTDAAVAVDRGLVQVTSFRSGERSDLGAGQGAHVDAKGMTVAGGAQKPRITRVAPSLPLVRAVGTVAAASTSTSDDTATDSGSASSESDDTDTSSSDDKGSSNSNAGGNDKSNAGGNGNGNGNAGGNGNGNAGGNGNSKDKDKGKSDDDDEDEDED